MQPYNNRSQPGFGFSPTPATTRRTTDICGLKWSGREGFNASRNPNFPLQHEPWVGCWRVILGLRRMRQTGWLIWFGFRLCLCNIRLVIRWNSADVGTRRSEWHSWFKKKKKSTHTPVSVVKLPCVYAVRQWDLWLSSYTSSTPSVVPAKVYPRDRIMYSSQRCNYVNAVLSAATCLKCYACSLCVSRQVLDGLR